MIDRKEKQGSIIPINGTVLVKFIGLNETKTQSGVIIPEDGLNGVVNFKGDAVYKVEILRKAMNVTENVKEGDYAVIYQLSGFGIPTFEDGYCKIIRDSEILMTSNMEHITLNSITPEYGRALVKITSDSNITESGVLIPEGSAMRSNWEAATLGGIVVKTAPGFGILNTGESEINVESVKIGDNVRFDAYMGTDLLIEGVKYRMVLLSEVLCKIED